MSIVFITSKKNPKDDFAKSLNMATRGGVSLMIVVNSKNRSLGQRIKKAYKHNKNFEIVVQFFYWLVLKLNKRVSEKLNYFRLRDTKSVSNKWMPEIMEVSDVNGPEVEEALSRISPELVVIWNTPIIKKNIIDKAKNMINLHMGVCPMYRGAAANQFAVYQKDFANIGATIHYVDESLDGGDILKIIKADNSLPPKKLFKKLNNEAEKSLLKIAVNFHEGKETLKEKSQSMKTGQNFALKYWTPEVRYKTAKILDKWEKSIK